MAGISQFSFLLSAGEELLGLWLLGTLTRFTVLATAIYLPLVQSLQWAGSIKARAVEA